MKKFMVIRQIEKNKFVELSGPYKTHEDALIEIKKWKKNTTERMTHDDRSNGARITGRLNAVSVGSIRWFGFVSNV